MKRLSARSNPTNLKELDKSLISITTSLNKDVPSFKIEKLSLDDFGLDTSLTLIIVAKAGNTSERIHLGTLANYSLEPTYELTNIDASAPIRFRLLIHEANNPQLIASIEKIRPNNDGQSESILPMEPADLGQRLWKLYIDDDGPVLQFNLNVFSNAAGTENYLPFPALVIPDALRQVLQNVSEAPERLDDESDPWYPWGIWLKLIGADFPPQDTEDQQEIDTWCNEVVDIFCNKHKFADQLNLIIKSYSEND